MIAIWLALVWMPTGGSEAARGARSSSPVAGAMMTPDDWVRLARELAAADRADQAPAGSVVTLSFAGFEKTCKVGPEGRDWLITIPALPASAEPKTLKVSCELDGELYAVNEIKNIVIGDVWYVAVGGFDFSVPNARELLR